MFKQVMLRHAEQEGVSQFKAGGKKHSRRRYQQRQKLWVGRSKKIFKQLIISMEEGESGNKKAEEDGRTKHEGPGQLQGNFLFLP